MMDKLIDEVAAGVRAHWWGQWGRRTRASIEMSVRDVLNEMFVRTDVQLHASKPPAKCLVLRDEPKEKLTDHPFVLEMPSGRPACFKQACEVCPFALSCEMGRQAKRVEAMCR